MRSHTVESGEVLGRISIRYYGAFSKFPLIIGANPILGERKEKGIVDSGGNPIIYPGDVLLIPDETENVVNPVSAKKYPDKIDAVSDTAVTLLIDGKQYSDFSGYDLTTSISSFDSISLDGPYFDTDDFKESFRPFAYKECPVYYGGDLLFIGILIAPFADSNNTSKVLSVNVYPKCGVLGDCPLPYSKFPAEYNGLTLPQIAVEVCRPYGIKVDFRGDAGPPFEKVSISPTDKVLDFIVKLAKERGFLVTNNRDGDLLIWKATNSQPVAFVAEGDEIFVSCSPSFDPQNYYSEITGLSPEKEDTESGSYTWKNPFLSGVLRPLNAEINDSDSADLKSSVESMAGRMFGSVGKYSLTLNKHRHDGGPFLGNNVVRVFSPNSYIYKEYNFLIETASLSRDADNGDSAVLSLVLPGAYTGELPEDIPWAV